MQPWLSIISMDAIVGRSNGAAVEEGLLSKFGVHPLGDGAPCSFLRAHHVE